MRDRVGLEHEEGRATVRPDKFVEQARFPQPRFTHGPDNLSVADFGLVESLLQLLQLRLSPHETSEAPSGRNLEPGTEWAGAKHFIDVEWFFHAFDLGPAQILKLKIPVGKLAGVVRHKNRARSGQLFHPRGQVG